MSYSFTRFGQSSALFQILLIQCNVFLLPSTAAANAQQYIRLTLSQSAHNFFVNSEVKSSNTGFACASVSVTYSRSYNNFNTLYKTSDMVMYSSPSHRSDNSRMDSRTGSTCLKMHHPDAGRMILAILAFAVYSRMLLSNKTALLIKKYMLFHLVGHQVPRRNILFGQACSISLSGAVRPASGSSGNSATSSSSLTPE